MDRVWYYPFEKESDRPILGCVKDASQSFAIDAYYSRQHTLEFYSALEKAKASDFEKENNEKYGSLGTTKVECEDSSAATKSSNSSKSDSPFIRFGLISFLFLLF